MESLTNDFQEFEISYYIQYHKTNIITQNESH